MTELNLQNLFARGKQVTVINSAIPGLSQHKILSWKVGEDVFVETLLTDIKTNVAFSCSPAADGYAFGYSGSGPATLALNILNQFVPPGTDGYTPIVFKHSPLQTVSVHAKNQASKTAVALAGDFEKEFLAKHPQPGLLQSDPLAFAKAGITLKISGTTIQKWIAERLQKVKDSRIVDERILSPQPC